jgi:hypothetical protein
MRGPGSPVGAYGIDVPQFIDARGRLAAFEEAHPLPFRPVRTFVITDVPEGAHRAQHVTRCTEFLWMAAGACRAIVRHSEDQESDGQQFRLVARSQGLLVPKGVWIGLCEFSPGSILVCMADSDYVARN